MLYIAITVFGTAAFAALLWLFFTATQDYARARIAMRRIAREPVVISRTTSRDRAA